MGKGDMSEMYLEDIASKLLPFWYSFWHFFILDNRGFLIMAMIMMICGILTIFQLSRSKQAAYGKFAEKREHDKWSFSSRDAWTLQECPSLIIPAFFLVYYIKTASYTATLLNFLMVLHYVYRTLYYPQKITSNNKSPLYIVICAAIFCAFNGYMQGGYNAWHQTPIETNSQIVFAVVGILVFFIGMAIHISHDNILLNLRKVNGEGYHIPEGLLFKYVSCPNYFGEILQWFGYWLISPSYVKIAFLVFTCCNLVPRAKATHFWYKQTFSKENKKPIYPAERCVIIPKLL